MSKAYKVTAIMPTIVVNAGEVVSLQAEDTMHGYELTSERDAILAFRNRGPLQATNGGPWVEPKNAVAYLIEEVN